jgi:hypothetical protein
VKKWVEATGYSLVPTELQGRALGKAAAAKLANKLGKAVPLIGCGFTILMAERMYAQGYNAAEIQKAVFNDLFFDVPGIAEAGVNMAWGQAKGIAEGAMSGAFSYITTDYDNEAFDGANGLITSDAAVEAILKRQRVNGPTVRAGDLIGGW